MEVSMKVIDMHCDTIGGLFHLKEEGKPQSLRHNSGHIDLERLRENHYLLQNFAMFIPLGSCGDPWEAVCAMYRYYLEELERNRDILAPVLRYEDIGRNEASGKISSLLTVEEGGVCKGELEKLGGAVIDCDAVYHGLLRASAPLRSGDSASAQTSPIRSTIWFTVIRSVSILIPGTPLPKNARHRSIASTAKASRPNMPRFRLLSRFKMVSRLAHRMQWATGTPSSVRRWMISS